MVAVGLALIMMALIGSLDHLTHRDFALGAFYLLPICWAAWKAGRWAGIFMSVAGVAIWLGADLTSGMVYRHSLTPYWNALMLFLFFLVVVGLLSAFQEAHYHLDEMVQRRTSALQAEINERKRLEAAKLRAERLALVGTMAAKVAHEIRNPLGSITLNLDLIDLEISRLAEVGGDSPEEGRTLIKEMRGEAVRIQRVLEEYLQFARLPKLHHHPLDLNALLARKLPLLNPELERANVRLRTRFDPALGFVNADGDQLWQIVLNLVRNGREAMPGGGELVIETSRTEDKARLRVADNGSGMTTEQLQRLFEPFFTTKHRGTGLGLALVQQIIIEHGGTIECESATGAGTIFTLSLPLTETVTMPEPQVAFGITPALNNSNHA
jgi:signal transduction histidine kinase